MILSRASRRSAEEKVVLEWNAISYSVFLKDPNKSTFMKPVYTDKLILKGLDGRARSGELLAIMGPTGIRIILLLKFFPIDVR